MVRLKKEMKDYAKYLKHLLKDKLIQRKEIYEDEYMQWLYEDVIGPIEYLTNKAEKYYKYSPQPSRNRHKYDIRPYAVPERLLIMANGYNPVDVEEVIQVRCAYGTDRRVLGPQLWNTFRAAYCCDIPDSSDLEYECNSDSCQYCISLKNLLRNPDKWPSDDLSELTISHNLVSDKRLLRILHLRRMMVQKGLISFGIDKILKVTNVLGSLPCEQYVKHTWLLDRYMVLHEDQGMNEALYAAGSLRAMMALGRVSESCRKSILIASNSLGLYGLTNDGPVDTYNINLRLLSYIMPEYFNMVDTICSKRRHALEKMLPEIGAYAYSQLAWYTIPMYQSNHQCKCLAPTYGENECITFKNPELKGIIKYKEKEKEEKVSYENVSGVLHQCRAIRPYILRVTHWYNSVFGMIDILDRDYKLVIESIDMKSTMVLNYNEGTQGAQQIRMDMEDTYKWLIYIRNNRRATFDYLNWISGKEYLDGLELHCALPVVCKMEHVDEYVLVELLKDIDYSYNYLNVSSTSTRQGKCWLPVKWNRNDILSIDTEITPVAKFQIVKFGIRVETTGSIKDTIIELDIWSIEVNGQKMHVRWQVTGISEVKHYSGMVVTRPSLDVTHMDIVVGIT